MYFYRASNEDYFVRPSIIVLCGIPVFHRLWIVTFKKDTAYTSYSFISAEFDYSFKINNSV